MWRAASCFECGPLQLLSPWCKALTVLLPNHVKSSAKQLFCFFSSKARRPTDNSMCWDHDFDGEEVLYGVIIVWRVKKT